MSENTIYRKDYQQPNYWAENISLGFLIENEYTRVKSNTRYKKNNSRDSNNLVLHGVDLELEKIEINGQPLNNSDYLIEGELLTIHNTPNEFELLIENKIYPAQNTALEGLYQSGNFFLTQCEAEGFRKITYFQDRPDVMATYDVTLVADKANFPILLSNGNKVSEGDLTGGKHYVKWADPHPKPSYLFALVAGDLAYIEDKYTTIEGNDVVLRIYVEKENLDSCQYAMDSLIRSMKWDEEKFGLAYDLSIYNIVATNDFNMGAMENKGLNIFNSKYVLAKPETATDNDFIGVEAVIGHEYFHNWTGNRVTCQDWFQLSLKEGLTVYRDQKFTSDMQSAAVKRIEDVRYLKAAQFAEDSGPMSHPIRPDSFIEINNFYTLTVYEKGAEVVGMYRTLLGEVGFRKGIDMYFKRHDGQAVTCDDFRKAMADANLVELEQFELWYSQNGTPQVKVNEHFNQETNSYELSFKQKAPKNVDKKHWKAMHIPVKLALFDSQGHQLNLDSESNKETVIELTKMKQTFSFEGFEKKPIASIFRGFSAPVTVKFKRNDAELVHLMSFDTDSFNRWDASQIISEKVILEAYKKLCKGQNPECPEFYIKAISAVLTDSTTDPSLLAEALSLPSLKGLMTPMQKINIHLLNQARDFIKKTLADCLEIEFLSVYNQNFIEGPYQVKSEDIARRSLKNTCLSYLMCTTNPDIARLCKQQYQMANNMTDAISALTLYIHHEFDGYRDILNDFYLKWKDNALVMDKWFIMQATSPASSTLENVKELMNHECFSIKNPNKVRSLIGAFASANLINFHREDGKGYEFLADQVITLNQLNPQVASRMVSLFNSWKQFIKPTRSSMKKQLERIFKTEKLSPDVYEIVEKTLS
jgi:aminopeptidase N